MSVHEKLAAFIALGSCGHVRSCGHESCKRLLQLSRDIRRGNLNDVLGVREPTIEDVQREAARVYGRAETNLDSMFGEEFTMPAQVRVFASARDRYIDESPALVAPTIAAAYAALRTLPDYEGEK
jgi:hypothetical protein